MIISLSRIIKVTTELLTLSFLKEEGFESNLKVEMESYLHRELVPLQEALVAKC